jgi:hypothetical protein
MCTVLLPPDVNPIAVNKYIITYHISYQILNTQNTLEMNVEAKQYDIVYSGICRLSYYLRYCKWSTSQIHIHSNWVNRFVPQAVGFPSSRVCYLHSCSISAFFSYIICTKCPTWQFQFHELIQHSRYSDWLQAGLYRDRIQMEARFSTPVQTGPGAHPSSSKMGTGYFPRVASGRGVTLTPHQLLVPWSWKIRAILLFPLWAVRPVLSVSACTRVTFTFTF